MAAPPKSKNAWRRAQAKAKKAADSAAEQTTKAANGTSDAVEGPTESTTAPSDPNGLTTATSAATSKPSAPVDDTYDFDNDTSAADNPAAMLDGDDPLFQQFKTVFEKFAGSDESKSDKPEVYYENDDIPVEEHNSDDDNEGGRAGNKNTLSRKKRKEQNKLSIAQLKATVRRPELVEWTDVSSSDPELLLAIKSHRNVVPVPAHWSLKREYLSSKRGIEKPPFQLPQFIQDTGITEMRDAALEKQAEQSLKQKLRERVQPKLGRLDIDYQKLYEAFFRFQTKPDLTRYGEVYYEGKEFETNMRHLRPGEMSDELKEALNMPPGAPPPWLINQQRFGPPPSYPALKIPGLNAPLPPGAQWGFHAGGYGKPPVDEFNRPLYGGDIFGVMQTQQQELGKGEEVERTLWGEIEHVEEEEDEDEDDDESEDEDEDMDADMDDVPTGRAGAEVGIETDISEYGFGPEGLVPEFSLREHRAAAGAKSGALDGDDDRQGPSEPARSAYQIIPERQVRAQGFFGSERVYDLKGAGAGGAAGAGAGTPTGAKKQLPHQQKDVDISVDLDALERDSRLTKEELKKQYEEAKKAEMSQSGWNMHEDLSNMIAEESQKRLRKDQERRGTRK